MKEQLIKKIKSRAKQGWQFILIKNPPEQFEQFAQEWGFHYTWGGTSIPYLHIQFDVQKAKLL